MTTALIVGHPDLTISRINAALVESALTAPDTDVRILADLRTADGFDLSVEQKALGEASEIVLLYPTYWYSTPGILKSWMDDVLTRGWAYGTGGSGALAGKSLRVVTTTGGAQDGYHPGLLHSFEYDAILAPVKATAHRLGMRWATPLIIHGARDVDDQQLTSLRDQFLMLLDSAAEPLAA